MRPGAEAVENACRSHPSEWSNRPRSRPYQQACVPRSPETHAPTPPVRPSSRKVAARDKRSRGLADSHSSLAQTLFEGPRPNRHGRSLPHPIDRQATLRDICGATAIDFQPHARFGKSDVPKEAGRLIGWWE